MSDGNDTDAYDPLDMLTDEEKAALNDSDFLEDDAEAGGGGDTAGAEDQNGAENAGQEQANEADAAAAEEAAAEAAAAAAETAPDAGAQPGASEQAPQQQVEPGPDYRSQIADYDQQIAGFKEDRNQLLAQFDDGELTGTELQAKLDELDEQSDAVKSQKAVAANAAQQDENNWNNAVNGYFDKYEALKSNQAVLSAFDGAVRSVTGNPAFAGLPFDKQLSIAHEQLVVSAKHSGLQGVPEIAGAKPPADPKPGQQAKQASGQAKPMREPPQTLANVPASDVSGVADSPFAQLERLFESGDSDAIEAAMQKLTPEQRDEFASMDIG